MKILFIRPPVLLWPYHPTIYPLSFLYLAAALLKKNVCEVKIIDCQVEKIGWKTLSDVLLTEKPDVVGISINSVATLYEGERLSNLVKQLNIRTIVLVGGVHVSATPKQSLKNSTFDIIVRFEGEITICELINELKKSVPQLEKIQGIAFRKGDEIILTHPRPLIKDLDDLPDLSNAYSLLKLEKYTGDIQYGDATIQASRGCAQKCTFCACWPHNSEHSLSEDLLSNITPKLRLRSVTTVLRDIETLYNKYNKRHFFFIDDCFNTNLEWQNELSEAIIKRKLDIKFTAFMRLDFIARDYMAGVFDKLIKAGLSLVISGIERTTNVDLKHFNKNLNIAEIKKGFEILHKYPHLIKLAIAIVGTQDDTIDSIRQLGNFVIRELQPDFCSFQALTPLPGTLLWEEIKNDYNVNQFDFSKFHWSNAVMPTTYLHKEQVRSEITRLQIMQSLQWRRILRALVGRYRYQREFYHYIYRGSFEVARQLIKHRRNIFSAHYCDIIKPAWYDS